MNFTKRRERRWRGERERYIEIGGRGGERIRKRGAIGDGDKRRGRGKRMEKGNEMGKLANGQTF